MFKSIFVLLSNFSYSFCYYKINKKEKEKLLSIQLLNKIIEYSNEKDIFLSFLYPNNNLPEKYNKIIEKSNHIKFVPYNSMNNYADSFPIIDEENLKSLNKLSENINRNIILRITKCKIKELTSIIKSLKNKFKRLNLVFLDIDEFSEDDFLIYKKELEKASKLIINEYKKGNAIEINFMSDRIFLNKMNNCNPGIDHLTFAPNGKFYICPGFYYDNKSNNLGSIDDIKNYKPDKQLLLEEAPICKICDAYHCKRCNYLNKKNTFELNTPSYQQCALSHYERNISKEILDILKNTPGFNDFNNLSEIKQINYIDPFQLITGDVKSEKIIENDNVIKNSDEKKAITLPKLKMVNPVKKNLNKKINKVSNKIENLSKKQLEEMTIKDLLIEIYKTQKDILKEFNKM